MAIKDSLDMPPFRRRRQIRSRRRVYRAGRGDDVRMVSLRRPRGPAFRGPGGARRLPLTGFPISKMVRLRYCQEVTLNAAAGAIAVNVFRANSLFDPDLTGVGHQPMGFDQWIPNIYNHYTVVGSKCSVTYAPAGTSNQVPSYIGIYTSDDGTSVAGMASVTELLEQKFTKRSRGVVGFSYHLVNAKQAVTTTRFSASKYFGKKGIVGDDLYRGSSTTNPTEQAFFEVFAASVGGADSGPINLLVTIDYIAVLTEPQTFASS